MTFIRFDLSPHMTSHSLVRCGTKPRPDALGFCCAETRKISLWHSICAYFVKLLKK